MKTILTRVAAVLLMGLVALLAAFTTLRLFIHGREVTVPNLTRLSDDDAAKATRKLGLNLSVENRFYSAAIAPNHVLSQSPVPGSRVRRGWQVRVIESLGGQQVNVPDVTGQTERPADLILRRLQLDPGSPVHLASPAVPGTVIAQSPPANAGGLTGPHIGLLVADDEGPSTAAYVMPQITGLTVFEANVRLASAGLHIGSATDPTYVAPPSDPATTPPAAADTATPASSATATVPAASGAATAHATDPAIAPPVAAPPPPVSGNAVIRYQSPAAGHRVSRADTIRVSASLPQTDTTLPTAPPL